MNNKWLICARMAVFLSGTVHTMGAFVVAQVAVGDGICPAVDIEASHKFHFYPSTKPVPVINLPGNRMAKEHLEMGRLYINNIGQVFVFPRVRHILESSDPKSWEPVVQEAYKEIRLMGGELWLKNELSEQVREWVTHRDGIRHVDNDVPSHPYGKRTEAYLLPNGTPVFMSKETHELLVQNWAGKFRPGNM